MPHIELESLNPDDAYHRVGGEIPPDNVPVSFSVPTHRPLRSHEEFKQYLREPHVREIVDRLHDNKRVVAASHKASGIVFIVAKHRAAIIATGIGAAGAAGGYHIFRKRRKGS